MKMDVKTNMQHFPVVYLTNRFHVAVGLFSSRSRKTSKVKTSVTHFVCGSRATYFVLPHFYVIYDLLLSMTHGNMESIC